MNPTAIVYTSNTGYTAAYAALLSEKIHLPVYSLKESQQLPEGTEIFYLGWLMAGIVKGYKKARKRFHITAVCGVGMGESGSQTEDVRKTNGLPDSMPVFTLQGGFDIRKLHGVYRWMMTVMRKTVGKKLAEKPDRTKEEDTMLQLLTRGGSCVTAENLAPVVDWWYTISQ